MEPFCASASLKEGYGRYYKGANVMDLKKKKILLWGRNWYSIVNADLLIQLSTSPLRTLTFTLSLLEVSDGECSLGNLEVLLLNWP